MVIHSSTGNTLLYVTLVITAAQRMSAGLYILPLNFFCQRTSDLRNGPAAPREKYINGRVLGVARKKITQTISPTPPLIFQGTGVKKYEVWPYTQQRSSLSRCGLETEQDIFTIFELEEHRLRFYILYYTLKIWRSLAHSLLRTVVWLGPHIGILNSSALLSQPVQRFPAKIMSDVGSKAGLAKSTQIFRPSLP